MSARDADRVTLSDEQRVAVEWPRGPLMVLAGAGTGKTTVIVERVACLLERGDDDERPAIAPEDVLVLTYNVRAAGELAERLERRLGASVASRIWTGSFHAFGHQVLQENAADAGLGENADVLDGIGQRLLLNRIRGRIDLLYHQVGDPRMRLARFAELVNRARDELVTPAEYLAHAGRRRAAFEERHGAGSFEATVADLRARGDLGPIRAVRRALAVPPGGDAGAAGTEATRVAEREARRSLAGDARPFPPRDLPPDQRAIADGLAATFLRDAEALDVLRIDEEARVYEAYMDALLESGAVDFADQIRRTIAMFGARPNVLRRYQERFRHILVDEFQDANVAQVVLLELLGRSPDADGHGGSGDVVVVGDDDQSVYRFRGASHAAFEQFRTRFGRPPAWDPGLAPVAVPSVSLLRNRRSTARILSAAERLISHNEGRLKDEPLEATGPEGDPVQVVIAGDEGDEADAIVAAIHETLADPDARVPLPGGGARALRPGDVAVLYRRHRHRDHVARRLREAGIPFAVVGGSGLFDHPDVRDLEAALRVVSDPDDSVSFVRLLAAPPWRIDAGEILRLTRAAAFDGRSVRHAAAEALRTRSILVDVAAAPSPGPGSEPLQLTLLDEAPTTDGTARRQGGARVPRYRPGPLPEPVRARLDRLMACLADLGERGRRAGPSAVLHDYLARAGLVRDLLAADTADTRRAVVAVGSFATFVSEWERSRRGPTLRDFVGYLDEYRAVGGDPELETGVGDADAVRLMTIHQAKGLEWEVVIVPRLVRGQFPDDRLDDALIPVELLRERPPEDFRIAEERRLCYVAMTRARSRLVLTTIADERGSLQPGMFVGEIAPGGRIRSRSGGGLEVVDQPLPDDVVVEARRGVPSTPGLAVMGPDPAGTAGRDGPAVERQRRAAEIVGALERLGPGDGAARAAFLAELGALGVEAAGSALAEPPPAGPSLAALAGAAAAGAELLRIAPLPDAFSHSAFGLYRECPLQYAFQHVYRIPAPEEDRGGWLAFGSMVHEAFEAYGRAIQDAAASGVPGPDEAALLRLLDEVWVPVAYPDPATAEWYRRRAPAVLANFHRRESARRADPVCVEQRFLLALDPGGGAPRVHVAGAIDRIDRLPDGSLELVDYKTGRPRQQTDVDADEQLSTYALAMREGAVVEPRTGRPLPLPARLTLYFVETDLWVSTTRTDAQLDAHRDRLLALAARIRSGDFAATPSARACERCDYRRLCPSPWSGPASR